MSSGRAGLTSLGESGGSVILEVLAEGEGAILVEVVADGGVDGDQLLQRSHPSKPKHRPLSSQEKQVRVLDPVVGVRGATLFRQGTELPQCSAAGPQSVCDQTFCRP